MDQAPRTGRSAIASATGIQDRDEKAGKLTSIHIEMAENGYEMHCQHESKKKPKDGMYDPGVSKRYVYETPSAVISAVEKALGGEDED